ncbi:MAG: hypothetical protein AB7F35_17735 [Acetobacteraceae bacterium]
MTSGLNTTDLPRTEAARRALINLKNAGAVDDLRFLETWEAGPSFSPGVMLRAAQIRRANPVLAAEIGAELRRRN